MGDGRDPANGTQATTQMGAGQPVFTGIVAILLSFQAMRHVAAARRLGVGFIVSFAQSPAGVSRCQMDRHAVFERASMGKGPG